LPREFSDDHFDVKAFPNPEPIGDKSMKPEDPRNDSYNQRRQQIACRRG
jgi:hypothetical protein